MQMTYVMNLVVWLRYRALQKLETEAFIICTMRRFRFLANHLDTERLEYTRARRWQQSTGSRQTAMSRPPWKIRCTLLSHT